MPGCAAWGKAALTSSDWDLLKLPDHTYTGTSGFVYTCVTSLDSKHRLSILLKVTLPLNIWPL